MKSIFLTLILLTSAVAHAQDLFGDDKKAFVLLPAEVISSGTVTQVEFSPSGRYITYQRSNTSKSLVDIVNKESPKRSQWYRYDRIAKASMLVSVPQTANQVFFFGDDQTAFYCRGGDKEDQGFINLLNGATTATKLPVESLTYFGEMRSAPYLMDFTGRTLSLFSPDGRSLSIIVPPKIHVFTPIVSEPGTLMFAAYIKGTPSQFGHIVYKLSDASVNFVETTQKLMREQMNVNIKKFEFWFEDLGELGYLTMQNIPKNYVSELPTKAKLCMSKSFARISPSSDCVAYMDAGALLIRDIKPIDSALARKLALDAAKAKAISDSKQAALALIIFASDMDGVLPGQEGWDSKVLPYSKDADLLKNFNYTFRGGNMAGVESPATTEMGFTVGPGGRAVAYVDGHVVWVPNP